MTPKEKARELINKMARIDGYQDSIDLSTCHDEMRYALIAVDEILKQFEGLHKPEYCAFDAIGERKFKFDGEYPGYMTGYDMVEYWEEVRSEINKIFIKDNE